MRANHALTVFVAGASGRFGGIVEQLLEHGHRVRAGLREPEGESGGRLRALGAEMVRADFDDPDSLAAAARGMDVVFATGTAHRVGPTGELRHGENLAQALATASGPTLVFVSGAGADRSTRVPVLEAKRHVEAEIRAHGVPVTVIAPVYLFENLFNPWNRPALRDGRLPWPMTPTLSLQQAALADVVSLAVEAIERSDELLGTRLEVASDEMTGSAAGAVLSQLLPGRFEPMVLTRDALPPAIATMFEWLERNPAPVDIPGLHERFAQIRWHSFESWAQRQMNVLRELTAKEVTG